MSWLITIQLTEEIVHSVSDAGKNGSTVDEVHTYLHSALFSFGLPDKRISAMKKHEDEALYARFADDPLTPPPNFGIPL